MQLLTSSACTISDAIVVNKIRRTARSILSIKWSLYSIHNAYLCSIPSRRGEGNATRIYRLISLHGYVFVVEKIPNKIPRLI